MNDFELLRCYAEDRSEEAFTELVKRYVDFVYSAAIRQVGGDSHLAHDVTQNVFVDLARKAPCLSRRVALSGWLYTSARFAAANIVRAERRRRAREQESSIMQQSADNLGSDARWDEVRPVLDSAMHALSDSDRLAILLRYFENRPLAEVGAQLGLKEDAARMRIGRALEKLRGLLRHRGVTSTTAALATVLTAHTVTAAPTGIVANVAGTALTSAATGSAPLLAILNLMNITKLKAGIVTALIVAGIATPLAIHQRANRTLTVENRALRRQVNDFLALTAENERLSNQLAQATTTGSAQTEPSSELLKLRAEVARLREDARELAAMKAARAQLAKDESLDTALQTLASRAALLRERVEQMPHLQIPELQFLTPKDWLYVAGEVKKLETEDDVRAALSDLRTRAKGAFSTQLQRAMREYLKGSGDVLPSDLAQLQPYFDPPVDPSVLDRYQLLRSGKLTDNDRSGMLVAEKAPAVDDEFDSRVEFGLRGMSSRSISRSSELLEAATMAYANANNGFLPRDPTQLAGYLPEPVDPARVQKYLSQRPANITTLDELKAYRR